MPWTLRRLTCGGRSIPQDETQPLRFPAPFRARRPRTPRRSGPRPRPSTARRSVRNETLSPRYRSGCSCSHCLKLSSADLSLEDLLRLDPAQSHLLLGGGFGDSRVPVAKLAQLATLLGCGGCAEVAHGRNALPSREPCSQAKCRRQWPGIRSNCGCCTKVNLDPFEIQRDGKGLATAKQQPLRKF